MKSLLCAVLFVVLALPAVAQQPTESYDDVMLVINERSWNSREVGAYFATRRNIPERNICRINVDTSETMDSATFLPVKWQIQEWMRQQKLVNAINYIVTTKGCPLRVRTSVWDYVDSVVLKAYVQGGQCSFEDCLALMNGKDSAAMLAVKLNFNIPRSRYYGSTQHFKRDSVNLPMYLVTRLDAYTVDQVKSYIQRAENPAILGEGNWVLDIDPGREGGGYKVGNDWLRWSDTLLRAKGQTVIRNNDTTYLHNQQNVIGYASWGSNDGHSYGGEAAKPGNTWLNGSIAETYVSTGARSFTPGRVYGQSLIADWIAEGVCGIKGYTDEPYLDVMARPHILFDRYTSGFNMAESYWAASPWIAWRQVVIGDPKMRLRTLMRPTETIVSVDSSFRFEPIADTTWVRNLDAADLTVTALELHGANTADFTAELLDGTFPATVKQGDSIGIIITCRPSIYGAVSALVAVQHQRGKGGSFTISFTATGYGLRPTVTAPAAANFIAGLTDTTAVQTIVVHNAALLDTIRVNNLSITGAGAAAFRVSPAIKYPYLIPGGDSLKFTVVYRPSASGLDSATLRVLTNGSPGTKQIKLYGERTNTTSAPAEKVAVASQLTLQPNPFSSNTLARYTVPEGVIAVHIELIDPLGRVVRNYHKNAAAGEQTIELHGENLASGMYLCRFTTVDEKGECNSTVQNILLTR
ncbi:MAG: TIGR03790 family protein [Armatimonadetes bacterium]|nr:TIGR03790 family protein [Armatimonadota bacterium]